MQVSSESADSSLSLSTPGGRLRLKIEGQSFYKNFRDAAF
jgi:hypothetical protein